MDIENELDKFLKIKTSGRDDSLSNYMNFPYEATPYTVLQILSNSGYITKRDRIIDFGCGKGRVDFYLAYYNKSKMIGIEYNERLYNTALENKKSSICSNKIEFINCNASEYCIPDDVTGAYFFNPFSIDVLKEVIKNIKLSKNRINREIKLFFYYPSNQYLEFLNQDKELIHLEDIDCRYLFKKDDLKEWILVYKI